MLNVYILVNIQPQRKLANNEDDYLLSDSYLHGLLEKARY